MSVLTFLRLAARHWLVTVPLLLLTAITAVALSSRIDPVYSASGSDLLLAPTAPPPATADPQRTGNPYADGNPALMTTAAALAQSLQQPDVRAEQAAAGHSSTYKITVADSTPILSVSDHATTSERAVDSIINVQNLLRTQLAAREDAAHAPQSSRITVDSLVVPDGASAETGSKVRLLAAVGVLGLAAIMTGVFAAERRSKRRGEENAPRVPPSSRPSGRTVRPRGTRRHRYAHAAPREPAGS